MDVRGLRNVVEHAAVASRGSAIAARHFRLLLLHSGGWSESLGHWLGDRLSISIR